MTRLISDYEAYLHGEGTWLRAWERLGARPAEQNGQAGYSFAVWAPTARRVSVVGDFNGWDGHAHPMRSLGASGLWETFVADIDEGANGLTHVTPRSSPVAGPRLDRSPNATWRRARQPDGHLRGPRRVVASHP
jgi:1,4-alpha-glucan branching enzyme